uniref:Uncharacterized protein n=1 Tax=Noctiluca scintillans TaxID=2966 RepID=A0A7S1AAA7_NOCSC
MNSPERADASSAWSNVSDQTDHVTGNSPMEALPGVTRVQITIASDMGSPDATPCRNCPLHAVGFDSTTCCQWSAPTRTVRRRRVAQNMVCFDRPVLRDESYIGMERSILSQNG